MQYWIKLIVVSGAILLTGCSNDEQLETSMQDCYNHYKANSYKVALESCSLAAELGEPQASWLLAQIYRFGLSKQGENPQKAFEYYLKAANQYHPEAMREVGNAYLYAYGIGEDFQLAQQWLIKANKLNDSIAAFSLGYIYYQGKGVKKDLGSAINWFMKAASDNHAMSINNLAWIYATTNQPAYFSAKKAQYWLAKMQPRLFEVPMFLDTKAAVYAAQNDFVKALEFQNQAIAKLPEDTPENEILEYQKHLESYQAKQRWQE
jgi:uncharacterized protein